MTTVRVHDSRIRRFLNIIGAGANSVATVSVRIDGKRVTLSAECKGMTRINYEIDRCDKLDESILSGVLITTKTHIKRALGSPGGLGYFRVGVGDFLWSIEGHPAHRLLSIQYAVEEKLNKQLPRCEFGIDAGIFHTVLMRALPFLDETDDRDRGLDTILLEITKDEMTIVASTGIILSVEKMHVLAPRVMPKSIPKIRLTIGYWVAKAFCKAVGYHFKEHHEQVYFRLSPTSELTTKEDGFITPSGYVIQYGPLSIYSECKFSRATGYRTVFKDVDTIPFWYITPGGINQLTDMCRNADSRDYITLAPGVGRSYIDVTYKSFPKECTSHHGIDGEINHKILLNPRGSGPSSNH